MLKPTMPRPIGMRFKCDNQPFGNMSVVIDVMMMRVIVMIRTAVVGALMLLRVVVLWSVKVV